MDFPTFLLGLLKEQTALIGAIAWPLAALGIATMFKREIRVLLGRIAAIRSPFADVDLKEGIEQTEAAVVQAIAKSDAERPDTAASSDASTSSESSGNAPVAESQKDVLSSQGYVEADRPQKWEWAIASERLSLGRPSRHDVGTLIAHSWMPIERLINQMFSFVTGIPKPAGLTASDKAMRLAKVGALSASEAAAVVELDALTGRMFLSQAVLEERSALDRYELMATSLRSLLVQSWQRLQNSQPGEGRGEFPEA